MEWQDAEWTMCGLGASSLIRLEVVVSLAIMRIRSCRRQKFEASIDNESLVDHEVDNKFLVDHEVEEAVAEVGNLDLQFYQTEDFEMHVCRADEIGSSLAANCLVSGKRDFVNPLYNACFRPDAA